MRFSVPVFVLLLAIFCPLLLFGQTNSRFWSSKSVETIQENGNRKIFPSTFQVFQLSVDGWKTHLAQAQAEGLTSIENAPTIIDIPSPSGEIEQFRILSYEMMEPDLANRFPEIKNYYGRSLNNPKRLIRLDWTYRGLHAMVFGEGEGYFIDPYQWGDVEQYLVYKKSDLPDPIEKGFSCGVETKDEPLPSSQVEMAGDCKFRTYRLAIATTGEYSNFHGATSAAQSNLVLSAVNTTMARVNGLYEKDLAIRMLLIGTTANVFYYNSSTDPFTNNSGSTMLGENQTNMTTVIGSANYDIGHVFSTGGGGVASLNSPCSSTAKARGVTGSGAPIGDPFDIDYVAHEMGHQFGGNHTFNNSCNSNRNSSTAYEPGSGSTIMAYAGICAPNVQNNSDAYFHAISIQEIQANIVSGTSSTCDVESNLGNSAPTAIVPGNAIIPKSTPFVLMGSSTDPNGTGTHTFCWEQMDNEISTQAPSATSTNGPNFRTYTPVTSPNRYFPQLPTVPLGSTWEVLPSVGRSMNFRMTVRDNFAGQGCTSEGNVAITVDGASGPFNVIAPASGNTWRVGNYGQVRWDVANTDQAPVNCSSVDLLLSTDGGATYPITLATGVANLGSAFVLIPNNVSTTARVMVKGSGNVFFDVSPSNFTIAAQNSSFSLALNPVKVSACGSQSFVYTVQAYSTGGFSGSIALTASGLPAGTTAVFSPTTISATGTSTLTITNTTATAADYTFDIVGTSGSSQTIVGLMKLLAGSGGAVNLTTPANAAIAEDVNTTIVWENISGAQYKVQVASDAAFNNLLVNLSDYASSTYTLTGLNSNTVYYWRISTNCGVFSTSRSFTTPTCVVYSSTNVPITISASGTPTVLSTLNVPDQGTVTDANIVNLAGTHSYVGDLQITAIHPDATRRLLFNRACNTGRFANFNLNYDDEGTSATIPCAPITGLPYIPNQLLNTLDTKSATGTWTLEVKDNANADGGALTSWGVRLCMSSFVALPVELISFNANPTTNSILLDWKTATEENNLGFHIERQVEGSKTWTEISFVKGMGTTLETQQYLYEDKAVKAGLRYYYRLVQEDFDGKVTFTDVTTAMIPKEKGGFSIFPNPTQHQFTIGAEEAGLYQVRIWSIDGKLMQSFSNLSIDRTGVQIDIDFLANGMYQVEIANELVNSTQRLMIQR